MYKAANVAIRYISGLSDRPSTRGLREDKPMRTASQENSYADRLDGRTAGPVSAKADTARYPPG
jgi:hypothetical protein